MRLTVLDKASSNARTERFIMFCRPGWFHINFDCEDHGVYGSIKVVTTGFDVDISGQINWGLTMNMPLARFHGRKIVRDICEEWVVIIEGQPPAHNARRLRALMAVVLAGQKWRLQRRLACQFVPNGDIHKRGVMEVYMPTGVEVYPRA